eukprot:6445218-Amphidinium_carterae.2
MSCKVPHTEEWQQHAWPVVTSPERDPLFGMWAHTGPVVAGVRGHRFWLAQLWLAVAQTVLLAEGKVKP